jgi:iron complex outermembrane receptor protein
MRLTVVTLPALFLIALPLAAEVHGRVVSAAGRPIENAVVEAEGTGTVAASDHGGAFALPGVVPPATLRVTHPRFEEGSVAVAAGNAAPVEVRLEPRQVLYEEITVSASREGEAIYPVSVAATTVEPLATAGAPATLSELVETVPGVSENGQGGIFQVFSIRGISRQRVLTLIDGMQVVGERRAGVSASFLDPRLLRAVDVVRGPSSAYYGSGALGGVVQAFPRSYTAAEAEVAYETQGDETLELLGWGDGTWSLGVARRTADDAETAAGERLFSRFEQTSAVVKRTWSAGGRGWELLLVPTLGEDIGKPNTEFPERATRYPEERHLLAKLGVRTPGRGSFYLYAHPQTLETEVREAGTVSLLDNESLDLGANWQHEVALRGGESPHPVVAVVGLDWFGRRGVDAVETLRPAAGGAPLARTTTLDGGEQDEAALYGSLRASRGRFAFTTGGRFTWQRQQNAALPSLDDTAWAGFAGLVAPLGGGWELAANVGSGLRFPSLSERYFTGATGRGEVVANPDLDPERSLNVDLGARFYGRKLFLAGYLFRNAIDDYIERVETAPDAFTFVNLTSGVIAGAELEAFYQVSDALRVAAGGHRIEGEDDDGAPLADVPPQEAHFGGRYAAGRWSAEARWTRRFAKDEPGSGEHAIPAADLLAAAVRFDLTPRWSLRLSGDNLTDEDYFPAADRRASPGVGRSIGIALAWRAEGGGAAAAP